MTCTYSVHEFANKFVLAAIVSVIALSLCAQAEIVYHPTDITISGGGYNLDLNGDGISDFIIAEAAENLQGCPPVFRVSETPASGNGALPGPLARGAEIGPSQLFNTAEAFLAGVGRKKELLGYVPCWFGWGGGPNAGTKTGYVGLSLQLNGQIYYGWAELQIKWSAYKQGVSLSSKLLGYAYEDIPGQPILAGETSYIWFTPAFLNFGAATLGTTVLGTATLTNLGGTTVTITNAKLSGSNSVDFAIDNSNPPCEGSVSAAATCTLTFTFKPSIAGKERATYSIYDNTGGSPQRLPLFGTGQ